MLDENKVDIIRKQTADIQREEYTTHFAWRRISKG